MDEKSVRTIPQSFLNDPQKEVQKSVKCHIQSCNSGIQIKKTPSHA